MDLSAAAAGWFLIPLTPLCLHVIWSDLSQLKIRNGVVEAIGMTYILLGPFLLPWDAYLWNYSHLLVALAIGLVLNFAGAMGAGDVKFIAVAGPYVARDDLITMAYLYVLIALLGFAIHRVFRATRLKEIAPEWKSWSSGKRFPMGFPLATVLLFYLVLKATGRL